jgi:branched-chain amino acid aminotransferase
VRVSSAMATVFLNGRFVSRDEAMVSAFDAGFQHGVGLFETMMGVVAARRGHGQATTQDTSQAPSKEEEVVARVRVVHLREHMLRLAASAKTLGLSDELRVVALEEVVERTVARASMEMPDQERFRVRLTITGGDLNMLGRSGQRAQQPTVMVVAQPATVYPREMFERGAPVTIADLKVNPLNPFEGHKTLNYWPRLRELQVAAGKGASEALVLGVTNHVAGGCVSNLFVVKQGVLMTPWAQGEEEGTQDDQGGAQAIASAMGEDVHPAGGPAAGARRGVTLPSPVLPGITRRWVMEWAEDALLDVERRMVTISDVLDADEVFLTNSSWGVLPVVRVEGAMIGEGAVGEVGRRLVVDWEALVGGG